jgi:hypothetical protein
MRESLMYGSVRGTRGNSRPYRDKLFAALHESEIGRFCCKSLFALVIKNSPGRTRDLRVKMWGTSSAGDLGNVIEATSTGGRRSDFFTAEKLAAGNLGLLRQYRH